MDGTKNVIKILSDQKIRAGSLLSLIKKGMNGSASVSVLESDQWKTVDGPDDNLIILVDLIAVEKPARRLLKEIRSSFPDVKIIALHMYRSLILVNPLFDIGINGYVYYEPSKRELIRAITSVAKGKKYTPDYLQNP